MFVCLFCLFICMAFSQIIMLGSATKLTYVSKILYMLIAIFNPKHHQNLMIKTTKRNYAIVPLYPKFHICRFNQLQIFFFFIFEACILSCKKWITSLGLIQDTGCLGLVHWDDPERWYEEGGGRGVQGWELMYTCGGFMSMYGKTNTVL